MINGGWNMIQYLYLEYDSKLDRVKITTMTDGVGNLHFSYELALRLGFDPYDDNLINNLVGILSPNISMGLPAHIYVYCDLIETQMIGYTTEPLSKIVHIDRDNYVHVDQTTVHYTSPHYMPVMKGTFETVEIDLRDHTGKQASFPKSAAAAVIVIVKMTLNIKNLIKTCSISIKEPYMLYYCRQLPTRWWWWW